MTIKRVLGFTGLLAICIACRVIGAPESNEDGAGMPAWLEGSVELEVLSGYLWHGMLVNDEPVFQPSVTLEALGFGFNLWANYDFTDAYSDEAPAFTEVNYTLYYSFSLAPFDCSIGLSTYAYPNTFEEVEEEDGTVSRNDLDDTQLVYGYVEIPDLTVVPSLTVEYTFESEKSIYAVFGLAYEHALSDALAVTLDGTLGWGNGDYNRVQFEADRSALCEGTVGVGLVWQPTERLALSVSLTYSYFVDSAIADAAEAAGYDSPDALVGGLKAGFSF